MRKTVMMLFGMIFVLAVPNIASALDAEAMGRISMWQIYILSLFLSFIFNMVILYLIEKLSEGVTIDDFVTLLYATLVFTVSVFIMSLVFKPSGILGFVVNIAFNGVALFITTRIVKGFRLHGGQYYVTLALGIALLNILIGILTGLIAVWMFMPTCG